MLKVETLPRGASPGKTRTDETEGKEEKEGYENKIYTFFLSYHLLCGIVRLQGGRFPHSFFFSSKRNSKEDE